VSTVDVPVRAALVRLSAVRRGRHRFHPPDSTARRRDVQWAASPL